ncbi:MAG: sugar isomerase, partial [Clostridia bacterium]|nr:sugar isomerase [Clostridia bacterium]
TNGIRDAQYSNAPLLLLFVVMSLMLSVKVPSNSVIEFAGAFEKTRSFAVWEMIINIAVSIIAILCFGICGALLGTIAALIYRVAVTIHYSNKKLLNRSQMYTYKLVLTNGAFFAAVMAILFVDAFSGVSFGKLILNGIIHSVWIVGGYLLVNILFNRSAFLTLLELYREKKKQCVFQK